MGYECHVCEVETGVEVLDDWVGGIDIVVVVGHGKELHLSTGLCDHRNTNEHQDQKTALHNKIK